MLKILVAADMEGVSGVVHWDHVDSAHAEYARFRKLMTGDVNAAIRGAYDAGADEVIVADGHGSGRNILLEELDPRARLNCGSPSPLAMVQGVDSGVSAAMFVGYHARVGSQSAILDHTWSSSSVANVWLNGLVIGEVGWNAAVCGHYSVPVILVSGDQTVCAEAVEYIGPVETAVVKQAHGRMTAECLPPEVSQQAIYEAARRAIGHLRAGESPQPLRFQTPVTATLEFVHSEMADKAAILPGVRRLEGKRIELLADNIPAAYCAFRAAVSLSRA
jgi:D-amino peptidase